MNNQTSLYTITSKMIKLSPTKANLILDKLRNKTYLEISQILLKLPKKNSAIFNNLYRSVLGNAYNITKIKYENLYLFETFANKGAILKRQQPRAKGQSYLIQKRFSYITIKICSFFEYTTLELLYFILLF